ncbi:MAG: hypothetical protein WCS79_11075, partial [Paludibacter sp.]
KSTNWGDPAAAKEANAKIESLSAKLTQALRQNKSTQQQPQGNDETPSDANVKNEMQQEMDDYNNKLWNQMMKIVREGDEGKMDLAEPLRVEIVQEYKDDEDPTIKSADWFQQIPYLLINVSMPGVHAVIDQMPLFRGIKILIVTCEKEGTPVNLSEILRNASSYPLEELYVLNFGSSVTRIPSEISSFSQLKILSFDNNRLENIPDYLSKLTMLNNLQIDLNPISELLPVIKSLKMLKQLSLVKTNVLESEIEQIQKLYPNCQITAK